MILVLSRALTPWIVVLGSVSACRPRGDLVFPTAVCNGVARVWVRFDPICGEDERGGVEGA